MQAAASVGFPITVSQVGSDTAASTAPISLSAANGWQPIVTLDEDELLHKLQTFLIQALNKPPGEPFILLVVALFLIKLLNVIVGFWV